MVRRPLLTGCTPKPPQPPVSSSALLLSPVLVAPRQRLFTALLPAGVLSVVGSTRGPVQHSGPATLAACPLGQRSSRTKTPILPLRATQYIAPHGCDRACSPSWPLCPLLTPSPPPGPGTESPKSPLPQLSSPVSTFTPGLLSIAGARRERRQPSQQHAFACGWPATWFTPRFALGAPAGRMYRQVLLRSSDVNTSV